jgi:predicted ester cyclase
MMAKNKQEQIKYGNDQLIGNGNFGVVEKIFATDYLVHTGGKDYKGHKFIRRWIRQLRSAISDVRVVKVEFFVQAGDTVAWQRTLRGTHKADMMGIPPTGRKVKWRDMMISRFDGEKIIEEWAVSELAGELLLKMPAK